jgi:entericidin B
MDASTAVRVRPGAQFAVRLPREGKSSAIRSGGLTLAASYPCPRNRRTGGKIVSRLIALVLLSCTALLAACNTVAGAGQDISNGGHAITNSAEKAQQ